MNEVKLMGRLGEDPKIITNEKGNTFAAFSMATSEMRYNKQTKESSEHTDWHRVVVFDPELVKTAGTLQKGASIAVTGKLQTRTWKGEDGRENRTTEVVLSGRQAQLTPMNQKQANSNSR